MQAVARFVDDFLKEIAGERVGFSLIVYASDDRDQTSYISNCSRDDAKAALAEILEAWQIEDFPDIPAHLKN